MSGFARAAAAVVVVAVMVCAIAGIGMGNGPAAAQPGPSKTQVAAARQRIAAGGASARRGREQFTAQGCDRCHSVAAIGATGALGPRLDTVHEDGEHNLESITDPRDKIVEGFPAKLMPTDFAARLGQADVQALADFVTAASGGKAEGAQDGGRGRNRGRGRGRGRSGGG